MISFMDCPEDIKEDIKNEVDRIIDPYGQMNPESLYKNIVSSTGDVQTLANIFDVMPSLIIKIKKINNLL